MKKIEPAKRYSKNDNDLSDFHIKLNNLLKSLSANELKFDDNLYSANKGIINISDKNTHLLEGLSDQTIERAKEYTKIYRNKGFKERSNVKNGYTFPLNKAKKLLVESTLSEFRKIVWDKKSLRCSDYNGMNNNSIVNKIIIDRTKKAEMLGYKNHASYRLSNNILNTPEKVMEFLLPLWKEAKTKYVEQMEWIKKDLLLDNIEIHDVNHYKEIIRKKYFSVQEDKMSEYLTYENVLECVSDVIYKVFSIELIPLNDDFIIQKDGVELGKLHINANIEVDMVCCKTDLIASNIDGVKVLPVVTVSLDIDKTQPLNMDDVITMFHEMGHASNVFLTEARYPSQSGAQGPVDFMELPSQLLERWSVEPSVLTSFAKNDKGESMPIELIEEWKKLAAFNKVSQHADSILEAIQDINIHTLTSNEVNSLNWASYEKDFWNFFDVPKTLQVKDSMTTFGHIFGNVFYDAQYYAYIYDDVLAADIFSKIKEAGIFDKNTCEKLSKEIYSYGDSRDSMESFVSFMGREPDIKAFFKEIDSQLPNIENKPVAKKFKAKKSLMKH